MNNLKKDIREALKDVTLDRQDKADLVERVANEMICHDTGMYDAIRNALGE